jgi:hypothetical protein
MMRGAVKTIVALALAVCVSCGDCPRVDDHARYEPVVARIQSLGLKPGERRQYRLDDPGNASTLRLDAGSPPPPRGRGAGTIWVEKDEQGHLLIAIETIDRGHAGEWGYFHGDRGVKMSREQSTEGPGREWTLDCDLGDGWWSVSYRLD